MKHRNGSGQSSTGAMGNANPAGQRNWVESLEQRQLLSIASPSAPSPSSGALSAVTKSDVTVTTGSVAATVTDANGNPIANASVYILQSTNSAGASQGKTNASGQYTFPTVPTGAGYTIHAYANGYLPGSSAPFGVNSGSNTAPAVMLTAAATIGGTVTDANGGVLANASVAIVPAANPTGAAIANRSTNAAGQYSFESLPVGSYVLRVSHAGYIGATSMPFAAWAGSTTASTVKLTAIVYGNVTGTVTDANGAPISGASVAIGPTPAGTGSVASVKTDSNGHYAFPAVPTGAGYVVHAYASGYFSGASAAFAVIPGSNPVPAIKLTAAAFVIGTVTDASGVALAGASVSIVPAANPSGAAIATHSTSATGQYGFESLPVGSYVLRVSHAGYFSATSVPFAAGAGNTTAPTVKLIAIVYGSVTGAVTDSNGAPIAGAYLTLGPTPAGTGSVASVKTDSNGNYTFASVPTGAGYVVHAYANGYFAGASAPFTVSPGSNSVPIIKLTAAAAVAGTVTDANGVALANASVSIVPAANPTGAAIATRTTNAAGQYSFESLPVGSYVLRVSHAGYFSATSAPFAAGAGNTTAPTVKLTAIVYGSVTGTVTDANGVALANASVSIVPAANPTGAAIATRSTNAAGQYGFESLPVGSYVLRVTHTGYFAVTTAPFVAGAGNTTAPTVKLTAIVYGSVSGTVTDSKGAPIANAYVLIGMSQAGANSVLSMKTDSNGNYSFSSVATGAGYVVRAYASGFATNMTAPFAVNPGANTAPTLKLTASIVTT